MIIQNHLENVNIKIVTSAKIRILLLRAICDYIAGMTDQYAMQQFNNLYGSNEMKNSML